MANDHEGTERRILDAAAACIATRGYRELSLRGLAKQLGLTTGAFYRHFANKDALLRAVSETISRRLTDEIGQEVGTLGVNDPHEILMTIGLHLLERFNHEPRIMDFLFFNPSVVGIYRQPESGEDSFPLLALTRTTLDRIVTDDHLELSVDELFIQVWSFIQGYGILIGNGAAALDENLIRRTLRTLTQ